MLRFFAPAVMMLALGLTGCSDDDKNCHDAACAATPDAGTSSATSLNGCTSYTAGTTINWTITTKAPDTCLSVKKGGSVTFNGSFQDHPLLPKGGSSPNPIQTTASGTTKAFTFDAVGTYGFICGNHPTMTGAIDVTE
jgi:plastocyanin